jgi:hypothetical protein
VCRNFIDLNSLSFTAPQEVGFVIICVYQFYRERKLTGGEKERRERREKEGRGGRGERDRRGEGGRGRKGEGERLGQVQSARLETILMNMEMKVQRGEVTLLGTHNSKMMNQI